MNIGDPCERYRDKLKMTELRVQNLEKEIQRLKSELETERLRLAACGVAALGYFEGCKDEYRSASLEDVLRLRDENKRLRDEIYKVRVEKANSIIEEMIAISENDPAALEFLRPQLERLSRQIKG
jgi:hypothetical protein